MQTKTPPDLFEWVGAIHTYSGLTFDIQKPTVDMVEIIDIAQALSLQVRYNGQIPTFYSVAEHSAKVCDEVMRLGHRDLALSALMHDAAEAYLGDLVRPLKKIPQFGQIYEAYEREIEIVIGEKYGITIYPKHPVIDEADRTVYQWEVENIRSHRLVGLGWHDARGMFTERFLSLRGELPVGVSHELWQF